MDSLEIPDDSFSDFHNRSGQNHLDDSKLGSILSTNSGGGGGGGSPCPRGKTMREFEAELAELRQENFELKMKIYVLEEQKNVLEEDQDISELRISHQHLQKELEKVKSELAEKEDLIFKAGEAMMLMSKKHEDDIALLRSQAAIESEKYKGTIAKLDQEIIELKEKSMMAPRLPMFDDSSAMYAVAFNLPGNRPKTAGPTEKMADLEEKILELESKLRTKSSEVNDLTAKSSTLKLEADQLRIAESNLKMELEFRVQKLSDALSNLATAEKQIQDLKLRLGESDISNQDIPIDFQQLRMQYSATKTENHKLQEQVLKLHQRITELEKYNTVDIHKKIDSLVKENVDLREKIHEMKDEGLGTSTRSSSHEKVCDEGSSDREIRIRELEIDLEQTRKELSEAKVERLKSIKTIQGFVKQNRALAKDVERLQALVEANEGKFPTDRGDHTPEPRKEVDSSTLKDNSEKEKSDYDGDDPEKAHLYSELKAKKHQVDQLNEKLRKRTIDLQEIVNKELWSKNKEIEKLNRLCEKQVRDWSEQRTKLKSQESEIRSLNEEIERLRQMLENAVSKVSAEPSQISYSEEGPLRAELEKVRSQLESEIEANKDLRGRCEQLKLEAEGWEKSRKDLVNACSLLTTRLEELTSFLESLLPSLAGRKRRLVKEAIDMSREVSRSLSLSCLEDSTLQASITQPILPDVSQVDFNSEEDPDDSLLPTSTSLGLQNTEMMLMRTKMDNLVDLLNEATLEKKLMPKQLLSPFSLSSTLQEQKEFSPQTFEDTASFFGEGLPAIALEDITEGTGIESFETDTDTKNIPVELTPTKDSKQNSALCLGSESEGWSEPDRTVSMARIGLKEETPVPVKELKSDSSDSPGKSNNSSVKKRRDSEIKSLQMKIRSLEMTIDSLVAENNKPTELSVSTNNVSVDCQLLGENTLTHNLMAGLMDQREKLMLSLNQNDLIRQRLEEALSSAPSSPTKSDNEKTKSFNSNLIKQVIKMTDKLEESCSLCLKLEAKCSEVEKEKLSLVQLLNASEDKANALSAELNGLRCLLKEKENDLLEKQCSLLELKNSVIILESKVKLSQEEVTKQTKMFEAFTHESNSKVNELKEKWEKERTDLINCYENEICIIKMKVKELEVELGRALSEGEKLRGERELMEGELKVRFDQVEREKREASDRRADLEGRLKDSLRIQAELQARLDQESSRLSEVETSAKQSERVWRRRVALLESSTAETEARLRRKLDQLTLSSSEAVIERTRIANERLALQRHHAEVKSELERQVTELELAKRELESRLSLHSKCDSAPTSPRGDLKRQRSNPTSDYTSDHDHHNTWFPVCGSRSNNNSSPDLGIESDNRMSSLEQPLSSPKSNGEPGKRLEIENSELRAQLARTRKALEETTAELKTANQRKRQVEKAICRQLHKTHDILQKARLNLEPSEEHH